MNNETTYSTKCPICDEEIEKDVPTEVDDIGIKLVQLELRDHMIESHSKWQLYYHGTKQMLVEKIPFVG